MLSCFTDKEMQQNEVLHEYLLLRDLWGRLDLALLRIESFQFLVFGLSSVFSQILSLTQTRMRWENMVIN